MEYSRLELFAGKPIKTKNNHPIYSPTIQEIADLSEFQYAAYVAFATFDENKIFKIINIDDKSASDMLKGKSLFSFLVSFYDMVEYLCKIFSFFTQKTVTFNDLTSCFEIDNSLFLSQDNVGEIIELIKIVNVSKTANEDEIKEKEPVFASERARKMYLEIKAIEQKNMESSEGYLDLKDMLSILCSAEGNGINIFNVFNLTYYQFRELFERMNMKESHKRLIPIWANNRSVDDKFQMPEWMKKT